MGMHTIGTGVANAGGVPSIQAGTFANRPTTGGNGQVYFAYDAQAIYQWEAGAWILIASVAGAPPTYDADNGITLNGSFFELGGLIVQNTDIQIPNGVRMRFVGDNPIPSTGVYCIFQETEVGGSLSTATDSAFFDASVITGYTPASLGITYSPGAVFFTQIVITRDPTSLLLRGISFRDDIFNIGPRAYADYSANWTSLSYITLGYLQANYPTKTSIPSIVSGPVKLTGQTTNQTLITYAVPNTGVVGIYRYDVIQTVTAFTSGTCSVTLTFTDLNNNSTGAITVKTISALGSSNGAAGILTPKAGTNITIAIAVTGTLTYTVYGVLELVAAL